MFASAEKRWKIAINYVNNVGHNNMLRLIQLRWLAVIGQISTIIIAKFVLHIHLPTPDMLTIIACLIAFNIGSTLRWQESVTVTNGELFFALFVDVIMLTGQLYLSGGTNNPFIFLYLLQVIISAMLLESWSTWFIIAITSVCIAGLSEFYVPVEFPYGDEGIYNLYVQGLIICFVLDAALLTFFINRISANLRAGEAQLADLRQRAAEEDHIVRMGLLASGAAHELGTPLATLSVILGDWQHMPQFTSNEELRQEIDVMQAQLFRCKNIISDILLSTGEVRGDSSAKTTLNTFLNTLAEEWGNTRPANSFVFENHIGEDIPVVFDSSLKQMIYNVLDNAAEASPAWVKLQASYEVDILTLVVTDIGPGFLPEMLTQFGKPYQSSKDRPGRGLGLFFAVNVARKLGGKVDVSNYKNKDGNVGGASVQMTLPLSAIHLKTSVNEGNKQYDV
ncbi:ATP-binding protein [Solimicrobium silvestre]|nr:ATP-binding protein [Solimicrobium silvestre]